MRKNSIHSLKELKKVKCLQGTSYVIPLDLKKLGEGAFGSVMRCYDMNRPDLDLAIKVIQRKNKELKNEAIKEQTNISKIPYCINLVNYYKFCLESSNHYYFIMEYCNNGNLFDLLVEGDKNFSEQEIYEFLVQFLNGYRELLKHNIIHRDIKPQNIMIHNGIYKIGDFGMSKIKKDKSDDILQFTHGLGSPFYQMDVFKQKEYTSNTDVYSLGIILFQMLFANPNRIYCKRNKLPEPKNPHPYLRNIKAQSFVYDLRDLNDQEQGFKYLDEYIAQSKIKRSTRVISLMKRMLMINPKERISFEELFEHEDFKSHLEKINNQQYQQHFQYDLLEKNYDGQSLQMVKQCSDIEVVNTSNILNVQEIKKYLIEAKLNICEELLQQNADSNKYALLQEKQLHYQLQLSQLNQEPNKSDNQNKITFSVNHKNKQHEVSEIRANEEENLNKADQKQFKVQSQNHQMSDEQRQQEENEDNLEDIDLDDLDNTGDKKNLSDTVFQQRIVEQIKTSYSRIEKQAIINKVVDILSFYYLVYQKYKEVALEICKSYHIVKSNSKQTVTDFTELFDDVSFLSLVLCKEQIKNLKTSYDKILLNSTVYKDNNNQLIDPKFDITEEDVRTYQNSDEINLFMRLVDDEIDNLNKILQGLMQKQKFEKKGIHFAEQPIYVMKEDYQKNLFDIIKSGAEEFGFLDEKTIQEFKKTLIFITELDQHERNNKVYYQKYKFDRGQLQLRFEQIVASQDHSVDLSNYCSEHNINLVAQVD